MEQGTDIIKKEEVIQFEHLLGEEPFIKDERDTPEYVNIHLFSEGTGKTKSINQIFQCSQCLVKYKKFEYLSLHSAIHSANMSCPVCSEVFTSRKKYTIHVNYHIKLKVIDEKKITRSCPYCYKVFSTKKQATLHIRVHTNERPHKCEICGEGFKQLGALKEHHVTHTKERRYVCEICNGAYTTLSSLKRHKKKIHDKGKTMNCKRCDAKFQNKADFNAHLKEAHPLARFQRTCSCCLVVFYSRVSYEIHKQHHSDNFVKCRRYLCKLCNEEIYGLKLYLEHRRLHLCYTEDELWEATKSKTFKCKFCPVVYKLKPNLYKHMDQHMEKTVKCEICGSSSTRLGLRNHKKLVHQILECKLCHKTILGRSKLYCHYKKYHKNCASDYHCNICGDKYLTKKMLQCHFQNKHQINWVKNFKCSICGLRFIRQFGLIRHKRKLHSFKIKLKCSLCNLTFETQKEIITHNLTHERNVTKHFRCKVCKKIFQSEKNYKDHISLKTCVDFLNKRYGTYKCKICDKNFSTRYNLRRHLQLHSDFDYQCQFCDKKTKKVQLIQHHMMKHHSDKKVFWCESCGEGFDVLLDYERHRSWHLLKAEKMESDEVFVDSNMDVKELKKEDTD